MNDSKYTFRLLKIVIAVSSMSIQINLSRKVPILQNLKRQEFNTKC